MIAFYSGGHRGDPVRTPAVRPAPVMTFGEGGIERRNAFSIVLWLVAFGSYLLAEGNRRRELT
jgi:hypothetical protein